MHYAKSTFHREKSNTFILGFPLQRVHKNKTIKGITHTYYMKNTAYFCAIVLSCFFYSLHILCSDLFTALSDVHYGSIFEPLNCFYLFFIFFTFIWDLYIFNLIKCIHLFSCQTHAFNNQYIQLE